MKEFKYVITDAEGIHARREEGLVREARDLSSKSSVLWHLQ